MAIDFEEEEEPKITLAICTQHNLKYDPEITWGCVLCRSNRKKRISGYWVVAVILALAAGIYFLLPVIHPTTEPTLSAMVSVGERSTDEKAGNTTEMSCLLKLSTAIEECMAKVDDASPNARMDKEFCLNSLQTAVDDCPQTDIAQNYVAAPLYKVNRMPEWESVKASLERRQQEIEECVGGPDYNFAVRIATKDGASQPSDVTLSLFGLETSARLCLYKFFQSLNFPQSGADGYTFVTQVESRLLAMHRPMDNKANQSAEFKKFVEQQRNATLTEERHAEIMKRRQEFDQKFKADMDKQ